MTGEEMERVIEFILQNQATLEERIERTQAQLAETQAQVAETNRIVQMQAVSQSEFNQTLTATITALAESQQKTEAKVDRLAGIVEKLAERLAP